jgi:putative chitinase
VQSACWWWTTHGLNLLADKKDFKAITKIINGGENGEKDREKYYSRALATLS